MDRVERLLQEASDLPWSRDGVFRTTKGVDGPFEVDLIREPDRRMASIAAVYRFPAIGIRGEANAALILHAVNNLPAYLEAVEQLEDRSKDAHAFAVGRKSICTGAWEDCTGHQCVGDRTALARLQEGQDTR